MSNDRNRKPLCYHLSVEINFIYMQPEMFCMFYYDLNFKIQITCELEKDCFSFCSELYHGDSLLMQMNPLVLMLLWHWITNTRIQFVLTW